MAGDLGDVPPKLKSRGELLTFANLPPSGAQHAGGLSANEGGQKLGVQGGKAPIDRALGGDPRKTKIRGQ